MARTPRRFGADPRDEGTTGGPRTTPMSPERKEVLRKAEEENARNRRGAPPVEKKAKGGEISNFGKAFRAARERGDKEFTFGKNKEKFNTRKEGESSKAYAAALAAAKPTADKKPAAAATATPAKAEKPVTPTVGIHNLARKRERSQEVGRRMGFRNDAPPSAAAATRKTPTGGGKVGLENAPGKFAGIKNFFGRGADALERINAQEKQKGANIGAKREAADATVKKRADAIKDTGPAGGLDMAKKKLARMGMSFKKGGKTMNKMKMAKGGSTASKRADGIAVKGKTKGMMPKMAKGGKMKGC